VGFLQVLQLSLTVQNIQGKAIGNIKLTVGMMAVFKGYISVLEFKDTIVSLGKQNCSINGAVKNVVLVVY